MALETLKDVTEIGGFEIRKNHEGEKSPMFNKNCYIYVNHNTNSISFTIQNGPIKEVGVNGCQVDTLVEAAKLIIEKLNEKFPCHENDMAIQHLILALNWLEERKLNREKRQVEGLSKA